MTILFICAGNVARSQIAEAIFNNLSKGKGVAISAGTKVVKENSTGEGQKIKDKDINIVKVMDEIGIDVSDHRRKQLTPKMFNYAEEIIVINPSENIPEYVKQSSKVTFWEVPDPLNQNLDFARTTRNQLQILVSNLISAIS